MNRILKCLLVSILIIILLCGCVEVYEIDNNGNSNYLSSYLITFEDNDYIYHVPYFNNSATYTLSNKPIFAEFELQEESYEEYCELDNLGRCTLTSAICCIETMPKNGEVRGSISSVSPSGWVQAKYDIISGKYLYNRCHLIGWQLTAENANKCNLITGTKYLNIDGMLPIENKVAKHIKDYRHYVAYQVTPIYNGNDLLPLGVQIEVDCVSCDATGTTLNVFCYNVQPGIVIDYATGNSKLEEVG